MGGWEAKRMALGGKVQYQGAQEGWKRRIKKHQRSRVDFSSTGLFTQPVDRHRKIQSNLSYRSVVGLIPMPISWGFPVQSGRKQGKFVAVMIHDILPEDVNIKPGV